MGVVKNIVTNTSQKGDKLSLACFAREQRTITPCFPAYRLVLCLFCSKWNGQFYSGEKVQSAASTHGHQAVSLPRTAPSVDLMMDAQALWAQAQAHPKMDSPDIGEENPSTIQVNLGVVWGICTTAKNSGYDSKY